MRKTTSALLRELGINQLYPPQKAALDANVEYGQSLVIATPTASGKTLIGLIGIVNSLYDNPGSLAVYTAPLRSIAYEKKEVFDKLRKLGLTTRLEVGNLSLGPRAADILITTYEKLDSILRNNPSVADNVSIVVFDELHYIGDEKRGPILEALVTRFLYSSQRPQLIGLSATMPNIEELAEWLEAKPISMDWRPVPLRESVYKDSMLHYPDGSTEEIPIVSPLSYINPLHKFIEEGFQSIVFSQSRRRVANLAEKTAKTFRDKLAYDVSRARELAREMIKTEGSRQLREKLAQLITMGVAFHHAGLSNSQRRLVEKGFREGAIAVIHATPTLAAGVNLPARVVIVEEYYRFEAGMRRPIGVYEYKQLAGRAGRPGYDKLGDAVLIASRIDDAEYLIDHYIRGEIEPIESKLSNLKSLRHTILGITDSGLVSTRDEILRFMAKSFYGYTRGIDDIKHVVARSVNNLIQWGLMESSAEGQLIVTPLGHLVSIRYLDPLNIPKLKQIIGRTRNYTETILLYLVASSPDMTKLPVARREEEYIMDRAIDEDPELVDLIDWFGPDELRSLKILFLLKDWINEVKDDELASRFNVGPGDISYIVETGEWLASSLSEIMPLLGLPVEVAQRLKILAKRIKYGVREELIPLTSIPGIGRVRARRLFEAGYKTLHDLAMAKPEDLARIPGIGSATVRAIMEYFGRTREAEKYKLIEEGEKSGLEAFMD
ncbi:MAG: DEAD/DEAH box helicase [Crenarchaeota archaeon]|nr:DEAD/DEAH box helicase [Thermoproteota archaeon]